MHNPLNSQGKQMNTLRKNVLIALTVLGMGSTALAVQAQTAAPEGRYTHAATQEQRMAKWGEHFAKRQAKLHDALQLTAAQEPAWAAYQAAIKPAAMGMHGDRAGWAALQAPARMEKMIAMSKQHTAAMESHLAALNTFYSVLTPAQKKAFDANTMGGMHGGRGHHRDGEHMKGAAKQ
jgi:Spy/CpxP family protein refolding chaperone